jgi:hypothetical protein
MRGRPGTKLSPSPATTRDSGAVTRIRLGTVARGDNTDHARHRYERQPHDQPIGGDRVRR